MAARILAVVAAVAMVMGAMAARSWLDQRNEDRENPPQLVCAAELADACAAAEQDGAARVTTEPAATTADRLAAVRDDPGIEGWLVAEPWPTMVDLRRTAKGLAPLFGDARRPVLARSPTVLAVWPDRAAAMRAACGGEVAWRCLGDVAAKKAWSGVQGGRPEWGPVKLALPDPRTSMTGLTVLGGATAGWFGSTDLSSAELENETFRAWLAGLAAAVTPSLPGFPAVVATGPSIADVYATVEAEAQPVLQASARPSKPVLIYPSPVATADIVLAGPLGNTRDRLRSLVADRVVPALRGSGWRPPEGSPNGLPDAGFLEALRGSWAELR